MTTIIAIITLAITTKEELFHTAIPSLDILREFYMCYFSSVTFAVVVFKFTLYVEERWVRQRKRCEPVFGIKLQTFGFHHPMLKNCSDTFSVVVLALEKLVWLRNFW